MTTTTNKSGMIEVYGLVGGSGTTNLNIFDRILFYSLELKVHNAKVKNLDSR